MKKILFFVTIGFSPAVAFAGQHSGLGGTPPQAPAPPEAPSPETSTLDEYQRWLQEQIEEALGRTIETQK